MTDEDPLMQTHFQGFRHSSQYVYEKHLWFIFSSSSRKDLTSHFVCKTNLLFRFTFGHAEFLQHYRIRFLNLNERHMPQTQSM